MIPPADGFYEPRLDTGFLPAQTGAKAQLVNAVLGPRTFEEVCAGKVYRTLCGSTPDELSQQRIEQFAGERAKLLVRTGETVVSKKRNANNRLVIIGASTLPISSSRTGPDGGMEWLGTTTLVHLTFLDPENGASETLNGFATVADQAARERVRTKFFPDPRTDALVLAETREASRHAIAVFRSLFPSLFHKVTSPLAGIDRIIDPGASLQNNDAPAFIRALGFKEGWPGGAGQLSGPCSLDHVKKVLFTHQSAKQSQWLARACAWYRDFERTLVNSATTATGSSVDWLSGGSKRSVARNTFISRRATSDL
jgi:hypothetical protein